MNFKTITYATLLLFLSGSDARGTKLNELRKKAPSASKLTQAKVTGKKVLDIDQSIDEQDEYIDLLEFAQQAFKGLNQQEIQDIIKENPELQPLNKPGPFDRDMISDLINSTTGAQIEEQDIIDQIKMTKKIAEKFSNLDQQLKTLSGKSKNGHRRNLEYQFQGDGEMYGNDAVGYANTLEWWELVFFTDPVIWNIQIAHYSMNQYTVAYDAIKVADEANLINSSLNTERLDQAEKLRVEGVKAIQKAYRWLKTSSSVLYRLLDRVQRQIIQREMQGEHFDEDEILKTEQDAQDALRTFGTGLNTSSKYIQEAINKSEQSRERVELVQNNLTNNMKEAKASVDGKSQAYKNFEKEQRAVAYGTCGGVCALTAVATGGGSCAVCFGAAAGILETKLKEFREKNEKLRKSYEIMVGNVGALIDKMNFINDSLDDLDHDATHVKVLVDDSIQQYQDYSNSGDLAMLTQDASDPDGNFAQFMEQLEENIEYEKNLRTCGTPDCKSTCMIQPILNDSSYSGCWNQDQRGNKCKNWSETEHSEVGNHNYCRDPDNKGSSWCFLEKPLDQSKTWDFCTV